jgi:hypothetical protein
VGTPAVDWISQHPSSKIRISRLTVVEVLSVFAIKVRTGIIGREDAELLLRQFQEDVVSGKFEIFSVGELSTFLPIGFTLFHLSLLFYSVRKILGINGTNTISKVSNLVDR